ncbi:MAG: CARDB domain-containing protein [Bryobacterales bacterium]
MIRVVADPLSTVSESNEANNEATFPLNVPTALLPDLTASALAANAAPDGNGNIDVTLDATLQNGGPSQAYAARVQFAVSTDGGVIFSNVGAPSSAGNIPGGMAGMAQRVWQNVAPGNYLVRLTADPDGSVDESDETNNVSVFPVNVPVNLLADLTVTAFNAVPQAVATGRIEVPLNATVQNSGPNLAKSVRVQFLVSSDGGVTFFACRKPCFRRQHRQRPDRDCHALVDKRRGWRIPGPSSG